MGGTRRTRRLLQTLAYFAAGFVCLAVYVGFDVLTNDRVILARISPSLETREAQGWLGAAEDGFKIIGEFLFVAALRTCLDDARMPATTGLTAQAVPA